MYIYVAEIHLASCSSIAFHFISFHSVPFNLLGTSEMSIRGRARATISRALVLLLVLVVLGPGGEAGTAAASASASACGSSSYNYLGALLRLMLPCKAAVAPFSPARPSDECCSAVRELGQPCFCLLLAGPPISGADRLMLSRLPEACDNDHHLLQSCAAAN